MLGDCELNGWKFHDRRCNIMWEVKPLCSALSYTLCPAGSALLTEAEKNRASEVSTLAERTYRRVPDSATVIPGLGLPGFRLPEKFFSGQLRYFHARRVRMRLHGDAVSHAVLGHLPWTRIKTPQD
jgi:hypothetical protein